VNIYTDTSVVVARTLSNHLHHANAVQLFRQLRAQRWTPVISTHGLAEVYSVLTRLPTLQRVSAAEASHMIQENLLRHFEIQALGKADYAEIVRSCSAQGWIGGAVYDAIHIHAARKAGCERVYTFNLSDFRRIAPDLHDRILSP
jgi:predicted nucleic acid-binding protein